MTGYFTVGQGLRFESCKGEKDEEGAKKIANFEICYWLSFLQAN
jgi:hypothetical protein